MVLYMFSIYDVKTEVHHPPFYAHNVGHAMRVFGDLLKDPQSRYNSHPDDYDLYHVGEFDDLAGVITAEEKAVFVVKGLTLKEQSEA